MISVPQVQLYYVHDGSCFIQGAVYVADWNGVREHPGDEAARFYIFPVNEHPGGFGV